jgi:hypothetical protein
MNSVNALHSYFFLNIRFKRVRTVAKIACRFFTYQHGSHWADVREIWYWGLSLKSATKQLLWLKSDTNSGTLRADVSTFYCCRRHKFSIFLAHSTCCILLTTTCSSTIHTERIVAFLLQQWLRERATTLYTYIVVILSSHLGPRLLSGTSFRLRQQNSVGISLLPPSATCPPPPPDHAVHRYAHLPQHLSLRLHLRSLALALFYVVKFTWPPDL